MVTAYNEVNPENIMSGEIVDLLLSEYDECRIPGSDRHSRVVQLKAEILDRLGVQMDDYRIERLIDGTVVEELRSTDSLDKFEILSRGLFVRVSGYNMGTLVQCRPGGIHELRLIRISDNTEIRVVASQIGETVYSQTEPINGLPTAIVLNRL